MASSLRRSLLFLYFLLCLSSGLYLRAQYDTEWYRPDLHGQWRPWAVEADCYERLVRVQQILEHHGWVQRFHFYENWPQGLIPSTTAPLDYLILLLYFPLKLVTAYPLDWAGALVSPLLWVCLLAFWASARLRFFNLRARLVLMASSALLHGFGWATAWGRPDHQSLILLLFGLALTLECERHGPPEGGPSRFLSPPRCAILAGTAWGLAMWTSLFEPLLLFLFIVSFNLISSRKEDPRFLISCGMTLLIALAVEHIHVFVPTAGQAAALENWGVSISELRPLSGAQALVEFTLVILLWPFLAVRILLSPDRRCEDLLLIVLAVLLMVVTVFQGRWLYYSSLAEFLVVARYFTLSRSGWHQAAVAGWTFLALLYSAGSVYFFFPGAGQVHQPSPELERVAQSVSWDSASSSRGIMAPWWYASAFSYFTGGEPVVACSSHCSISGLIDSGRFYNAVSWDQANSILQKRRVRWVLVYDDPVHEYTLLNGSGSVLGLAPYRHHYNGDPDERAENTVGQRLIEGVNLDPHYHLRSLVYQFKLYEFSP